jgi:SMI1 / KNR4 family (SUKH-1)
MDEFSATRVLKLLSRLQDLRPTVFGSDHHKFQLNEPVAEHKVTNFERDLSIHLPPDYRDFLIRMGNGGAGPFYGVFPLGTVDENFGLRQWHVNDGLVGDPSRPFDLSHEWNDTSLLPSDENQAEYDRQMDDFEKVYFRPDLLNGAIPICHQGCALRIWLVVTGETTGHLWDDRRSEYEGIRPLVLKNSLPATFGAWYLEWLQDSLTESNTR